MVLIIFGFAPKCGIHNNYFCDVILAVSIDLDYLIKITLVKKF